MQTARPWGVVTTAELEGQLQAWSFLRKTCSTIVNTGTVWAALAVGVGYLFRRWWVVMLATLAVPTGAVAETCVTGKLKSTATTSLTAVLRAPGLWSVPHHCRRVWFPPGAVEPEENTDRGFMKMGLKSGQKRRTGHSHIVKECPEPVKHGAPSRIRTRDQPGRSRLL